MSVKLKCTNLFICFCLSVFCLQFGQAAFAAASQIPRFVKTAPDLGPSPADQKMRLRFWLKAKNMENLKAEVDQILDPSSPRFHQWLSSTEVQTLNAVDPTHGPLLVKYLIGKGLHSVQLQADGLAVTAAGSVSEVENALELKLHQFSVAGKSIRANISEPVLPAQFAEMVAHIGGLSDKRAASHVKKANVQPNFYYYNFGPYQADNVDVHYNPENCFHYPRHISLKSEDGTQYASYFGNLYGPERDFLSIKKILACFYDPQTLQFAYGMKPLYQKGMDGHGQTIVLLEAYGSPTLRQDLAYFNHKFGLPDAELKITNLGPEIVGPWNGDQAGWSAEATLDVEFAHMMAPGAKLHVVEAASDQTDDDLGAAILYAVQNDLGNVISNSWISWESFMSPSDIAYFDQIFQLAAAKGISINFSSGDWGDNSAILGYIDESFPSSPYVTVVGGTSLALYPDLTRRFETGWGNNFTYLGKSANSTPGGLQIPFVPPINSGFVFGSGGGVSSIYAKPAFQHALPGSFRMTPDISYLADAFTGVPETQTAFKPDGTPDIGNVQITISGGTSLSTPLFSAMWAIANQYAGKRLGVAAPILYKLPRYAIYDVAPVSSYFNVRGETVASGTKTYQRSESLIAPITKAPFYSVLFHNPQSPSYYWNVISFGTDSTLKVEKGWDNVTGLGVPNGEYFAHAVKKSVRQ